MGHAPPLENPCTRVTALENKIRLVLEVATNYLKFLQVKLILAHIETIW